MMANCSNTEALEHLLMTLKHKSTLSTSDVNSNANNAFKKRSRVAFSESSMLYAYEPHDRSLLKSLSYCQDDYDEFGKDALVEGLRVKNLIESAPQESIAESIKYLLRNRIITRGELVGIENYILGNPSGVSKLRRDHSKAVLRKQREQQKLQLQDPINLGKAAQISSIKSMKRAQVRAAMAA